MTKLNETVGAVEADGLIADLNPGVEVFSVKVRKGSATAELKRGTVLALSTGTAGDGAMVVLGTAASNETLTANAILAEDVVVGTEADATALAYRAGHFAGNKLIVADSYTLTAADKEALRSVGILLSDVVEY